MSGGEVVKGKFCDGRKVNGRVSIGKDVSCVEMISLCWKW